MRTERSHAMVGIFVYDFVLISLRIICQLSWNLWLFRFSKMFKKTSINEMKCNWSLKAMCEYIRRGQTSDFKLLSDAKCILGRTVRVKEVYSLPKAIYFPCDHGKLCAYKIKTNCKWISKIDSYACAIE